METEIYRHEIIECPIPDSSEAFGEWDRREQLVKDLDLRGQERYMFSIEQAKEIPFTPLTPEEWIFWQRNLRRSYLEDGLILEEIPGLSRPPLRLKDYDVDLVPLDILDTWKQCREKDYFEHYEIRTDSGHHEPILLGHVPPLVFLIARWGVDLKPLEQLKNEGWRS